MVACLVLGTTLSLAPDLARAQAREVSKPPRPVAQALAEMDQLCRDNDGKPAPSPGLLSRLDLNGDGRPDYALDQGAYVCDGAASLFSGSGGSQLLVWVSTDGPEGWLKAYEGALFELKAEHKPQPRLLLAVSGAACGQKLKPSTSHAAESSCWRPLKWNPQMKALQLAPLSEIRPY